MMYDVWTVARKEWLEIVDQLLRFKRGGWSVLLVIVFLGVFSPLQMGKHWLSSPLMFFYWPLLTMSMTSTLIADAVAGERERHTLETLLATRLSDSAILLGKIVAAVGYGCSFAITNIILGLIVVNIQHGEGRFLFFSPGHLPALIAIVVAVAFFISGLGVFVSLRSPTVRQAQQTFGVIILVMMMTPVVLLQVVAPTTQERWIAAATQIGLEVATLRAALAIAAAAIVLNAGAIARFKRGQLALE